MRWNAPLAAFACLGLVSVLWGDESPGKAAPAPSVAQLIERLGSPDFKTREAASQALLARGSEVLPALQKAQDHSDPEVRRRLEDLIPTLEAAVALAPKRVTMKVTNRPLKEVIDELGKATGYKIILMQENGLRERLVYSFQFDGLPFWEALHRVCEAGGLVPMPHYYGDDALRLHANGEEQYAPFVCHSGAFRVMAQSFSYGRNLHFGTLSKNVLPAAQRSSEYLYLALNISVEPRLPLLNVGQVRLLVAEDEHKNSLIPPQNGNGSTTTRYYHGGGFRCFNQHVQTNLVLGPKPARTLTVIRGVIPVTLLAEQKPLITVENVLAAKGKKFEAGSTQLDVDDVGDGPKGIVAGNGKAYQLKLSLRETRPEAPHDYSWVSSLAQRLELVDAKGNKYASRGYSWNETTPNSVKGATFNFAGDNLANNVQPGPPAKLIYYNWLRRDHEVDFEFRDLPLP